MLSWKRKSARTRIKEAATRLNEEDPDNRTRKALVVYEDYKGLRTIEVPEGAPEVWDSHLGQYRFSSAISGGVIIAQAIRGPGEKDVWTIKIEGETENEIMHY